MNEPKPRETFVHFDEDYVREAYLRDKDVSPEREREIMTAIAERIELERVVSTIDQLIARVVEDYADGE